MGVHFLKLANIGPRLDPAKPQVLIYEPVKDKLKLVAAEWFVPVEAAGTERPQIFSQQLSGPMDGHEPIMPATLRHYDLHVWLWKNNPRGVFTSTNAAVKCPESGYPIRVPSGMPGMKHRRSAPADRRVMFIAPARFSGRGRGRWLFEFSANQMSPLSSNTIV